MSIVEKMAPHQPQPGSRGSDGPADSGAAADPEASGDSGLVQRAVAHAKAGRPEGVHFLYVRFAPDVVRHLGAFVNDRREAELITQAVFAKLVTTIREYEPRQAPFAEWILGVSRSAALDQVRARRKASAERLRSAVSALPVRIPARGWNLR
jgi:DNA-directed RNA polymerase specialized sigma24 family protein